jgi:hypothetical protein
MPGARLGVLIRTRGHWASLKGRDLSHVRNAIWEKTGFRKDPGPPGKQASSSMMACLAVMTGIARPGSGCSSPDSANGVVWTVAHVAGLRRRVEGLKLARGLDELGSGESRASSRALPPMVWPCPLAARYAQLCRSGELCQALDEFDSLSTYYESFLVSADIGSGLGCACGSLRSGGWSRYDQQEQR